MLGQKNAKPSIADQAQSERDKQITQKIDKLATQLSNYIRHEIWEANLDISMYDVIMKSTVKKVGDWFNQQINNKKMQDVIDDPTPKEDTPKQ